MIDPRKWPTAFALWDVCCGLALTFVALVTPFEAAFLEAPASPTEHLFLFNRVVDLVFIVDFMLQWFLMVQLNTREGVRWISQPSRVAVHYIKSWFFLDALSVGVSTFDYLTVFGDPDGVGSMTELRTLRVLRALRLIKLIKVLGAARVFKRWETKIAVNYAALSLIKCLIGLLVESHWFACIWTLQAKLQTPVLSTWLGKDGVYCHADDSATSGVTCLGTFQLYVASFYWAVYTITSIGFGDITPTPGNTTEQLVTTLLLIMGAISWSLVVAIIVANLSGLDPEADEFTTTMGELNKMMMRQGLPTEQRVRLREYYSQSRHVRVVNKQTELLSLMSPTLKSEVAFKISKEWLAKVWYLEGLEESEEGLEFLVQLSVRLRPLVLAPGEMAPANQLYIVKGGLGMFGGKVVNKGKVFGEDMIMKSMELQNKFCARAMNYLEVLTITREELDDAALEFPVAQNRLRRCAVRLATRRAFIAEAKRRKKAAKLSSSPVSFKDSLARYSIGLKGKDLPLPGSAGAASQAAGTAELRRQQLEMVQKLLSDELGVEAPPQSDAIVVHTPPRVSANGVGRSDDAGGTGIAQALRHWLPTPKANDVPMHVAVGHDRPNVATETLRLQMETMLASQEAIMRDLSKQGAQAAAASHAQRQGEDRAQRQAEMQGVRSMLHKLEGGQESMRQELLNQRKDMNALISALSLKLSA